MIRRFTWLLTIAGLAAVGCSNPYRTAAVRGRVTSDGKPVTRGTIMFIPVEEGNPRGTEPGKPAQGAIDAEGQYVLSTYGDRDGAVIGKHQIMFVDDYSDKDEELYENAPPRFVVPPDNSQVEVVAGKNEIAIELAPNPEAARFRPRASRRDD
jgi:hypothetical protein